ncbi:hypothetical protein QTV44_000027 [Vibrio vulnificus]|nr:hypothetical protein [Vibrio vulnificus]
MVTFIGMTAAELLKTRKTTTMSFAVDWVVVKDEIGADIFGSYHIP